MKEIFISGIIMIKLKNIILIAVIGIVVILSGCIGGKEAYQVQVTEVRTLSDCIRSPYSSEATHCTLINIQVKNNNFQNLDFILVKEEVVAKSTRVLPGRYEKEVGLNDLCTRQAGMEFVLTENSQRNIGLCYPTIDNAEGPVLKVETLINSLRHE
jgi:hypothetical protein